MAADQVQSTVSSDESKRNVRVCRICNKDFSKQFNLDVHMMIHTGERPFQCDDCDLAFRQKSHLRKHWQRVHMNQAPVTSESCLDPGEDSLIDYHSAQSSGHGHEKHKKAKTRQKKRIYKNCRGQHLCDVCGKSYTRKQTLLDHQRIHTREKPFLCQICGKSFAYNSALKTHGQVHRDEKMYVCDHEACSKAYGRRNDLLRHVKRKHLHVWS